MAKIIAKVVVKKPIEASIRKHIIIGRITHTGGNSVQKLSELENDTGYITVDGVPKNLSDYNNDTNFITSADIPPIPNKVSQLDIDITTDDLPEGNNKYVSNTDKTKLSKITIDSTGTKYLADDGQYKPINIPDTQIQSDWQQTDNTKKDFIKNKPTIPTKTSDLTNDSDYITEDDIPPIPSKTSDLTNDSGFIDSSALPTKVSELEVDIDTDDIPEGSNKYISESEKTNLSKIIIDGDGLKFLANDGTYKTIEIPSGIKVEMLERTTNKTVTLSEEPYADQYTGYNVVIINITDNRLYTANGTQYLFPNINNANLTVSNKVVTTTGEDFDNYVLAVYITDENDGLAFQFKFMIFGMLSSSLLSGHFMTELSSLNTDAKTYLGAVNELKYNLDNLPDTSVVISELTYDYAITQDYKYTFVRDVNGIIISVIKEEL